jgi:hypothetical protein
VVPEQVPAVFQPHAVACCGSCNTPLSGSAFCINCGAATGGGAAASSAAGPADDVLGEPPPSLAGLSAKMRAKVETALAKIKGGEKKIKLSGNDIGDAGATALAQALPGSAVTEIWLQKSKIGAAGATALAQALPGSAVTKLRIRDNKIGAAGATALAQALPGSAVTYLNMDYNSIGDAGATALAQALPGSAMTYLQLDGNDIKGSWGTGSSTPEGAKGALAQAWRAKHGDKAYVSSIDCSLQLN